LASPRRHRDRPRRLALAVVVAVALFGASAARAASVIIVRPAGGPPAMLETLVRLQGELASAGFATEIIDAVAATESPAGSRDARPALEQLAARRGADAVVAIVGDLAPDSVEVWVIDKVTGKSLVRRVPFEPGDARASKTLALRAIELLRSSFLEIDLALTARERGNGATGAPPPAVVHLVEQDRGERPAPRPAGRFGFEVGGAAIVSADGIGPALLPLVRFGWSLRPWLFAQATLAGLGTRPTVQTNAGSAEVSQAYGLLGVGVRFRTDGERARPFATLSAGALHTSVDGRADAPNQGHAADQWSLLVDAAFGCQLRLPDRFYLSVAGHAQLAEPYLAVRFVDTVVATSGRPNLLLTFTIGAWL
jgi:hypothetical protein